MFSDQLYAETETETDERMYKLIFFMCVSLNSLIKHQSINETFNNPFVSVSRITNVCLLSVMICIWGVLFGEFWKREEKYTALEYGQIGFEDREDTRGEFKDYEVLHLVGEETLFFPYKKKNYLVMTSFMIISLLCCGVIGTTACIYVIRYQMATRNKEANDYASIVASILNVIQIQIWTFIFGYLSDFLTDRENHQTDTQYEDSMIVKNFVFSFINT